MHLKQHLAFPTDSVLELEHRSLLGSQSRHARGWVHVALISDVLEQESSRAASLRGALKVQKVRVQRAFGVGLSTKHLLSRCHRL